MATIKNPAGVPLEEQLQTYLVDKAPFQLPEGAKEWLVKYSPWIALVIGILLLPAVLAVIGLGSIVGTYAVASGYNVGILYWLSMIVLIVQIAILFIAFPQLRARKIGGWKLLYLGVALNLLYDVVSWISHPLYAGGLISGLIGAIVGLYFLFQIKSKYKA